jgi:SAM-dependent methyltransferase
LTPHDHAAPTLDAAVDPAEAGQAHACPACRSTETEIFFAMRQLPVHGQAVHATREASLELTRGDQVLAVCHGCSFVFNTAFDPGLLDYSGAHEESQAFSPAFRKFASELAAGWTERYDLAGDLVLEIGCGKGDFLKLWAETGLGRAHGVDPGIDLDRLPEGGQVTGERAYYAPSELSRAAVAIACRHTLEHIPDSTDFIGDVVAGLDPEHCRALLFEVPDLTRVLTEAAFWDLQYEHCSSFTAGALKALFERHGLEVLDLRLVYGGQYLIIEADPKPGRRTPEPYAEVAPVEEVVAQCHAFAAAVKDKLDHWTAWFAAQHEAGRETVVWGGGAKGLVFLNNLPEGSVRRVVDINKGLHGAWLGGVGVPIVAPEALTEDPPQTVLLMNEVYLDEVRKMLDDLGLTEVELLAI